MPEAKRTGGCQCGAVRYELTGEPLPLVVCHCRECQKQTASAFGMSLPVAKQDLRIVAGALKEWRRLADSGCEVACWFCPDCGSRIYHSFLLGPRYWHLKPGTLDDTSWLDPVAEVWAQSAQPWLDFSDRLLSFAREPDDDHAITVRWQRRKADARKSGE
jgi:hypothetical protein